MADDERDKMEAALAILGMANSAPATGTSLSSNTGTGTLDMVSRRPGTGSPNGTTAPSRMHIPVPKLPQPRIGIAVAKIHKQKEPAPNPPVSNASIQHTPPVHKPGVLPKVPRNVWLRSKLESRIQAREEAAALNITDQSELRPESVKTAEMSPKKRRRRQKKYEPIDLHDSRSEAIKGSTENVQCITTGMFSGNQAGSIKKHGEIYTATASIKTVQSIKPSSQCNVLEYGQSTQLSHLTGSPKIETNVGDRSSAHAQNFAPNLVTHINNSLALGEVSRTRPTLSLNIPSKTEKKLPPVSYSPISPADTQPAYTVIGTPTLRTVPNPMQLEPLDLSKDTTKPATVPLMQIIAPNISDFSKLPLLSPMIQSPAGMLMGNVQGLPFQYLPGQQQKLAVKDGELVCVMAEQDSNSNPVVASPGAIVSNPSALLANPAAYGLQLVQDPKTGHALLVPSPRVTTEPTLASPRSPALSRQNSRSKISPAKALSPMDKPTSKEKTALKSPKPDVSPKSTDAASPSPKPIRAQSSLPPKKRRYAEQENPQTPVSPMSVASTVSSFTDEGYSTLNQDIMLSPSTPVPVNVVQSPHTNVSSAGVMQAHKFAQLGPQPRMSTGLGDSSRSRATQALLLPKTHFSNATLGSDAVHAFTVAQSLPANLDTIESPPTTPAVTSTPQKDSMQEQYAQKLFEEYQRSLREGQNVRAGKSPFQHFRPVRSRRSNTTKVSVDLNSGGNWRSSVTAKMERDGHTTMKPEAKEEDSVVKRIEGQGRIDVRVETGESAVSHSKSGAEEMDVDDTQRDARTPRDANDETPSDELREGCKKSGQADEDGDLPIHIAVVHENLGAVEKLLYMMQIASVSVDHANNDRQTPLHLAIITKNDAILSSLLQAGSNPNLADRKGCTGIHLAVKHNSRNCLLSVFQESKIQPDLNAKNYEGYTALHMSVIHRNADFVQLLLLAGATVDIQDNKSGRTALFHAAETKQFNIASLLLQKGASVNILSYSGTTPVQAANGRGHSDLVALLIKYGADVSTNLREGDGKASAASRHSNAHARSMVQQKLKTRRKLRRLGSTGDLTIQLDPQLRAVQDLNHHSHSLDIDINPSTVSANQNEGLKIVLPHDGGIAASMPLSPSALGLATRRTLPMIPPMQAKSLPDDVVKKPDTHTSPTSPKIAQTSMDTSQKVTPTADQLNQPPRILGSNPLQQNVMNKAVSVASFLGQSLGNFGRPNQRTLSSNLNNVTFSLSQTSTTQATLSTAFAMPSPMLQRSRSVPRLQGNMGVADISRKRAKLDSSIRDIATKSQRTSFLGQVLSGSTLGPNVSSKEARGVIKNDKNSASELRNDAYPVQQKVPDGNQMDVEISEPSVSTKSFPEIKQDSANCDKSSSVSGTVQLTEQSKLIGSLLSTQIKVPPTMNIPTNVPKEKHDATRYYSAKLPTNCEVTLDPITGELVPVEKSQTERKITENVPTESAKGVSKSVAVGNESKARDSVTSSGDVLASDNVELINNKTDINRTLNSATATESHEPPPLHTKPTQELSPNGAQNEQQSVEMLTLDGEKLRKQTRSDTLESDESVELSASFLESINARDSNNPEETTGTSERINLDKENVNISERFKTASNNVLEKVEQDVNFDNKDNQTETNVAKTQTVQNNSDAQPTTVATGNSFLIATENVVHSKKIFETSSMQSDSECTFERDSPVNTSEASIADPMSSLSPLSASVHEGVLQKEKLLKTSESNLHENRQTLDNDILSKKVDEIKTTSNGTDIQTVPKTPVEVSTVLVVSEQHEKTRDDAISS